MTKTAEFAHARIADAACSGKIMATVLHAQFKDVDEFLEHMKLWGWAGSIQQSAPGAFDLDLRV